MSHPLHKYSSVVVSSLSAILIGLGSYGWYLHLEEVSLDKRLTVLESNQTIYRQSDEGDLTDLRNDLTQFRKESSENFRQLYLLISQQMKLAKT